MARIMATRECDIVTTVCEWCGKEDTPPMNDIHFPCIGPCSICRRDICHECDVRDNRDDGDYPAHYCPECWGIGEGYRKRIDNIQCIADEDIAEQEWMWKETARKAAKQATEHKETDDEKT